MIRNLEVSGAVAGDKPVYRAAVHVRSPRIFEHDEFINHIRSINGIIEAPMAE